MGTCASRPARRDSRLESLDHRKGSGGDLLSLPGATVPKNKANRKFFYLSNTALSIYFSDVELQELANACEMHKYSAQHVMYSQGDLADVMYVIGSGELKLFVDMGSEEKRCQNSFVAVKTVGDIFGIEALIMKKDSACRVATARVMHNAELVCIGIAQLKEFLKRNSADFQQKMYLGLGLQMTVLLPNTSMFKDTDADFSKYPVLWNMFRWKSLAANECLFEEGSFGKELYVVYEGALTVEMSGNEIVRSKTVVAEIKKGDTLGEIGLLIDAPRSGTVTAKEPTALLALGLEEFNCLLDHFPGVARKITEIARKHVVYNFRKYNIPFFQSLNEQQYNLLGELCSIQQIPPGEIIFDHGDFGDRFYMIAHGDVGIYVPMEAKQQMEKLNEDIKATSFVEVGGQIEVSRIGPGRYFGELALVTDALRCATARAHSKCVILSITRTKFARFFEAYPEAASDFQIKLAKYKITLFQILAHPRGLEYFCRHCRSEFSEENVQFYFEVKDFEQKATSRSVDDNQKAALTIIDKYVSENSHLQVNLPWDLKAELLTLADRNELDVSSFANSKKAIFELMERDSYQRFKSSPLFQEFLKEMEVYDYVQKENLDGKMTRVTIQ